MKRPVHTRILLAIGYIALLAPLPLAGCVPAKSGEAAEEQVFELGRDDQVRVRIPAANKGLGSTEEYLNLSFTKEELRRFLGLREL